MKKIGSQSRLSGKGDCAAARILGVVLAVLLVFASGSLGVSSLEAHAEPVQNPGNLSEFIARAHIETTDADRAVLETVNGNSYALGLNASYTNFSKEESDDELEAVANFLEKYDLRDVGGVSYITSVKFQNPWGTCWAFGSLAAIESNIIKQNAGTADSLDLSERHLAWFTYQAMTEADAAYSASPQMGEGRVVLAEEVLNQGAFPQMTASTLSSGQGVERESVVPYKGSGSTLLEEYDSNGDPISFYKDDGDWSVDGSLRFNAVFQLDEACTLPSPASRDQFGNYYYDEAGTNAIKQALMDSGAVNIGYAADQSQPGESPDGTYFNHTTWAQYTDTLDLADHSVTIVGWDDTYDVSNFNVGKQPPRPGAWIVKNSWGSIPGFTGNKNNWGIGGTGYFYLSYYDQTISDPTTFTVATIQEETYDATYQYDMRGHDSDFPSPIMFTEETSAANVFTITEDQLLQAVSAVTYSPGATVNMEVYKLDSDGLYPRDGELLEEKTLTFDYAGYHRISLDTAHEVRTGERIAVVESVSDKDDNGGTVWFAPVEDGISRAEALRVGNTYYSVAVAHEGESFIGSSEGWSDATKLNDNDQMTGGGIRSYGNANIKLFANTACHAPLEPLTITGATNTSSAVSDSDAARVSVTGILTGNPDRYGLVIHDVPASSPALSSFSAQHRSGEISVALFDLRLRGFSLAHPPYTVSLPVSEEHNGKSARVFHYVDGGKLDKNGQIATAPLVDVYEGLTVVDGRVTVVVNSLSPFEVVVQGSQTPVSPEPGIVGPGQSQTIFGQGSNPKPLARAGDSQSFAALACLAICAGGAVLVLRLRLRIRENR